MNEPTEKIQLMVTCGTDERVISSTTTKRGGLRVGCRGSEDLGIV